MANNSLSHHGILGQKWGIRRFQNRDGSLTPLGKQRALSGDGESFRRHGERVAKDKREGAATAEKVTKGVGKTVGAAAGVGAGILGVGATDLSVAAAEAAASHIMSTASLSSILSGSAAASASTAANLAGLGTLGAAAGVGGLVGAGVVGTGAAVIGHLIKKHGEKKAADIEEKYSILADKMSHYSEKQQKLDAIRKESDTLSDALNERRKERMNSKEFKDWYKSRKWDDDDVSAAFNVYARENPESDAKYQDMAKRRNALDREDFTLRWGDPNDPNSWKKKKN